jgi:hypothetical protein
MILMFSELFIAVCRCRRSKNDRLNRRAAPGLEWSERIFLQAVQPGHDAFGIDDRAVPAGV